MSEPINPMCKGERDCPRNASWRDGLPAYGELRKIYCVYYSDVVMIVYDTKEGADEFIINERNKGYTCDFEIVEYIVHKRGEGK